MTDRHRQLGASTAAPELAEPCTECRGFANVPQMLRGRWARGVCHACGGAGTRAAQAGRALPWVGDDELGARVKAQSAAMAAAIAFDVSAGEVATHPPALDDADDHRADATRYAMCASGPLLGRDNWNSRRAPWAAINEPPKPTPPALLDAVREAAPMFRWELRPDRPVVHAHAGNVTVEVCRLGPNLYAILCAGAMERGLTSARVADLPTVLRELVRHPDCPPDARAAVLALLDQCP